MNRISEQQLRLKRIYDSGDAPLDEILNITLSSIRKLNSASLRGYGTIKTKHYYAFTENNNVSRPVLESLFVGSTDNFDRLWKEFINSIDNVTHTSSMEPIGIDKTLYTVIMSFACCIDLWKPKSRKTAGTHLEVVAGSVLSQFLPGFVRSKFIALPNQSENVSTDIVFKGEHGGLVIPAKTTTRERIVQPYAHQRILDSIFGIGKYNSILMCVSETQRDDRTQTVKEICVPGTIRLFQAHLSKLAGIYYLDPPTRYLRRDVTSLVPVKRYSDLLKTDLPQLVAFTKQALVDNN